MLGESEGIKKNKQMEHKSDRSQYLVENVDVSSKL